MGDNKNSRIDAFLNHPLISAAVIIAVLFCGRLLVGMALAAIIPDTPGWIQKVIAYNLITVLFLILFFLYRGKRKKYIVENAMQKQGGLLRNPGRIFLVLLPALVYDAMIISTNLGRNAYGWDAEWFIYAGSLSLSAGIVEEIMCRSIPMGNAMRNIRTRKQMLILVAITSLVFGAVHMSNMRTGATFTMSLGQSIHAAGFGCIFAAIFLRTGSIIPGMMLHFFHDFILMYTPTEAIDKINEVDAEIGEYIDGNKGSTIGVALILALIWAGVALFMLRRKKWEEIKENFEKKET